MRVDGIGSIFYCIFLISTISCVRGFAYQSFLNILRNNAESPFNIGLPRLCVDYAPNLIGLAGSNPLGVVRPMTTIENKANQSVVAGQIITLAKNIRASEIIVGLPVDPGDRDHDEEEINERLCWNFGGVLSCIAKRDYPQTRVVLFDESYSTKEARWRIEKNQAKGCLDSTAAACILESYIDDEGGGAIDPPEYNLPLPECREMFDYREVLDNNRRRRAKYNILLSDDPKVVNSKRYRNEIEQMKYERKKNSGNDDYY